eukprot:PhM_4_TR16868/c0_g1_i1/m.39585
MFFSPYKSSRVLGREFLSGQIIQLRRFVEGYASRSWGVGAAITPTNTPYLLWLCIVIQYMSRYNQYCVDCEDVEKILIMRHGGTVDSVRQLSKEDQIRARSYIEMEKWACFMLPPHLKFKPEGYDE